MSFTEGGGGGGVFREKSIKIGEVARGELGDLFRKKQ
jgi:hypothetical protein